MVDAILKRFLFRNYFLLFIFFLNFHKIFNSLWVIFQNEHYFPFFLLGLHTDDNADAIERFFVGFFSITNNL